MFKEFGNEFLMVYLYVVDMIYTRNCFEMTGRVFKESTIKVVEMSNSDFFIIF